jgi:hypothetical protein
MHNYVPATIVAVATITYFALSSFTKKTKILGGSTG